MKQLLLDTNIVIYLLNGDPRYVSLAEKIKDAICFISIVTWIEVLAGSSYHKKTMNEVAEDANIFIRLPLNEKTSLITAQLLQFSLTEKRKKNFQDTVIAATALTHNIPLLTNNPKDFRRFKGLKIISPKM